ncbi:MAG: aminotransferase class I/II-fold pyridoxal phosphate-dependent enzyme [Gammaproteobacteria bacterium]|nr:aminotransferase class I/II-fold pyridoxal phosphate-dependent enzyme [Gammaproteobacteria bacterium]
MMNHFPRIKKLPPYIFSAMDQIKKEIIATGAEIYDFGLGNPDQPTAPHIIKAMQEAVLNPALHRYAPSRGIPELRRSICHWYEKKYSTQLDPETEAIVTIGSKEGLAHLMLAILGDEDTVLVPDPCYPVHYYGCLIADANVERISLFPEEDFLNRLEKKVEVIKPKLLMLNFPGNPTTQCVDLSFFERVVALAKKHKFWVMHDLAYADLVFEGYKAPSILQVPGAKEVAVESYTLSKTYSMAGWRVGFMCGNPILIDALARIKSYLDYGSFAPVQMAAIAALEGPQDSVAELCQLYQHRRDVMCEGLKEAGWEVNKPKASMFLWLKIPEPYRALGSMEFTKLLLRETHVVFSAGIGFGQQGDDYIRISLVENDERMEKALSNIKKFMKNKP